MRATIVGALLTCLFVGCAHKPKAPEVVVDEAPRAEAPPAPPASPPPPAPAKPDEDQDLLAVLDGAVLHFEFDQALLTEESRARLERIADALRKHPEVKVRISGHCDERGTTEYNFALGQRRAEVARNYLVTLGVKDARVETVSYGEEKPASPGSDADAWARNRRDEIRRL